MAAILKRRAFISAIILAATAATAGSLGAQDETRGGTASPVERAEPARDPIVTDPDLRRMEERRRRVGVLSGLFERQTRVFRISYRLLYAAVDMCPAKARPALGFTYANAYMFQGGVRTAATAMGYSHRVSVVELAPNSAGERAGVRRRDEILAIDDWPVPYGEGAVTLTQAKLRDVLVRDSRTTLTLRRGTGEFTVVIEPDYICDIQVLAVPGDPIRSYANGDKVVVFEGLLNAIEDDDVLAAALAREIANDLIPDLDIDTEEGVDWSSFFDWGLEPEATGDVLADQSLAQDYGNAADYVGAYLMARAGFDHRRAPELWYRMANRERVPPQYSYGIPEPEYLLGLEQTVAEIDRKLAAKAPLRPEQSGPPAELASAPEPTGAVLPTPAEPPEPTAVAEAEPAKSTEQDPAAEVVAAPEAAVSVAGLPWTEAPTPDATKPSPDESASPEVAAAVPETEIADLPWISESGDAVAEPVPSGAEITVSRLESEAPQLPSVAAAQQIAPDQPGPLRGSAASHTLIPETETPRSAMADLGLVPPATDAELPHPAVATTEFAASEPDTVPAETPPAVVEPQVLADLAPSMPVAEAIEALIPESETPATAIAALARAPKDQVVEASEAKTAEAEIVEPNLEADPQSVQELATAPSMPATETALVPGSELPSAVIAALEPTQIDPVATPSVPSQVSIAPEAVSPQPARSVRRIIPPPTGESEIAVLFRNQVMPETLPSDSELSIPSEAPQIAAVPVPSPDAVLPSGEPPRRQGDDYDIGDLIRELESGESAAADKLATPEEVKPQIGDLPWLTEGPDPAEVALDPAVAVTAAPPLMMDGENLTPPSSTTVAAGEPPLAPPTEAMARGVEPSADETPVEEQESQQASLVPDPAAGPVDELPVVATLPKVNAATQGEPTSASPAKLPSYVEPSANAMPMVAAPDVQASLVPDQVPTPVDDLPVLAALPVPEAAPPDDKVAPVEKADIDEESIESDIDLIAPSAGQTSVGADPADLDNGFSFRAWLGKS